MTIAEISDLVQMADHRHGPVMIGVDGISGAGKTEFAKRLKQLLPEALIVSIDDFIDKSKLKSDSWDSGVFDRARLEREVLRPLTHQRQASYEHLDWDHNRLTAPELLPETSFVIVEGTTTLHPDIAHFYDYKVWIDTPTDVAMSRGMARDRQAGNDNDALWPSIAKNDQDYIARHHPNEGVDFVFANGGNELEPPPATQ